MYCIDNEQRNKCIHNIYTYIYIYIADIALCISLLCLCIYYCYMSLCMLLLLLLSWLLWYIHIYILHWGGRRAWRQRRACRQWRRHRLYVFMCVYIYIYIYTHTLYSISLSLSLSLSVYIHIYVYTYIYMLPYGGWVGRESLRRKMLLRFAASGRSSRASWFRVSGCFSERACLFAVGAGSQCEGIMFARPSFA